MTEDGSTGKEIDASVSEEGISLKVSGQDAEWVDEKFDEKLEELEQIQQQEPSHYHVAAGAGWLMAETSAESPEEAMAIWMDMWDRMLEDVEELSDRQRQQAGLTR